MRPVATQSYTYRDGPQMRQAATIGEKSGVSFDAVEESFQSTRERLIDSFISCLENRFADTKTGVIGACKIADFHLWPESSSDFGDEEVGLLVDHFGTVLEHAGVNVTDVELEWDLLKKYVYSQYTGLSQLQWDTVNKSGASADCGNILCLIDLIHTIPAHSADAERGFSEMKLAKSDWRSCLRPEVLSDLLFIIFHTADIQEYDPTEAIELWNVSGQRVRRPGQRPYGPRNSATLEDNTNDPFMDIDPDFLDQHQSSSESSNEQ